MNLVKPTPFLFMSVGLALSGSVASNVNGLVLTDTGELPAEVTPVAKALYLDIDATLKAAEQNVLEKFEGLSMVLLSGARPFALRAAGDNDFRVLDVARDPPSGVDLWHIVADGSRISMDEPLEDRHLLPRHIYSFAVPEPSSLALLLGSPICLAMLWRQPRSRVLCWKRESHRARGPGLRQPSRQNGLLRSFAFEAIEHRLLLTTFTVDSTGDFPDAKPDGVCDDGSGNCTLRAAIEEANHGPGADTIQFAIQGVGPQVINPSEPLPSLTDVSGGTTIDGRTQTLLVGDANPNGPEIIIDGGSSKSPGPGFFMLSGGNRIFGLNIRAFDDGIAVAGSFNWIAGNYIGTDETGSHALGNRNAGVAIIGGAQWNCIGTNGDGSVGQYLRVLRRGHRGADRRATWQPAEHHQRWQQRCDPRGDLDHVELGRDDGRHQHGRLRRCPPDTQCG